MTTTQAAVATLQAEAAALTALAKALPTDAAFAEAIQRIIACKGRVIVTGVGKSGHIGGKIAASLASTGTPAFFVHPTEALHGDLGMITAEDIVLALSHSGESKELLPVLAYTSRFSIPVIAITGHKSATQRSTLANAATLVLNTLVEKEACPLNLAPTTSTTTVLALADALTVALMTARGFTEADFAKFHPGGKLGAQLLRVAEVMVTSDLPLLPTTAPMSEVLIALTNRNLGCVGLVDAKGHLTGIFTDGDLKRRLSPDLLSKTAADVMTASPRTIESNTLATAAVAAMEKANVTSLWVLQNARPTGLLRLQECLHAGVC